MDLLNEFVIDRFEGEWAIIEFDDGTQLDIPRSLVTGAREGECLKIFRDEQETVSRQDQINDLFQKLKI